jgi:hypothetical protein
LQQLKHKKQHDSRTSHHFKGQQDISKAASAFRLRKGKKKLDFDLTEDKVELSCKDNDRREEKEHKHGQAVCLVAFIGGGGMRGGGGQVCSAGE